MVITMTRELIAAVGAACPMEMSSCAMVGIVVGTHLVRTTATGGTRDESNPQFDARGRRPLVTVLA